MTRERRQYTTANSDGLKGRHGLLAALLLAASLMLVSCSLGGYQTVADDDGVWMLDRIQRQSLPDASHVLAADELPQEQAAVAQWMLQHLQGKYQIIERRFYLSRPGFTETAQLRSRAASYVEQTLGIVPQPGAWSHGKYEFVMWTLKDASPRYFALVINDEPPPSMEQRLLVGYFELVPASVVSCAQDRCRIVGPPYGVLDRIRDRATPEPPDRLSPPREQRRAKAAMVQWTEQYLKNEYRVVDQRFVLTEPGFTQGARVGSKAHQYVTQTLGGTLQTDGWFDDDSYKLFFWTFGDNTPRCIAFVMTRNFLPGTRERRLVGYFELMPALKR